VIDEGGGHEIGGRVNEPNSIALIRRFVDACVRADPDEFIAYFTERMKALPWEIRHIVADGDVVLTERLDHFVVGDARISVPCMGVFELRDGKIAAWRDYWDLREFERQVPPNR